MKFRTSHITGAGLMAALFLSSCAGSLSLNKRHYSRGYQVELSLFEKKDKTQPVVSVKQLSAPIPMAKTGIARIEQTLPTPAPALPLDFSIPTRHRAAMEIKNESLKNVVHSEYKASVKANKTDVQSLRHQASIAPLSKQIEDETLLYLIIAFFIPFLGVLLYEREITNHFWISLLLTFLFWLPGFIYAALVILGEI